MGFVGSGISTSFSCDVASKQYILCGDYLAFYLISHFFCISVKCVNVFYLQMQ